MRFTIHQTYSFALTLAVLACGGGDGTSPPPDTRCAAVTCSGHGTCAVENDAVVCRCAEGYTAAGLACNPTTVDPCSGVTCSGHGTCAVRNGAATCTCAEGYTATGLACNPTTSGAGACTATAWGIRFCISYTGSAWTTASAQLDCQSIAEYSSTYSAECSTTGVVGKCRMYGGTSQEGVTYYYGTSSEIASAACINAGGVVIVP